MDGDGVLLIGGDVWMTIPLRVQRRIKTGAARIGELRAAIANEARIQQMPPVSIDPAIWTPGDGASVHAASGVWPSINGGHEIMVLAAASMAICRDPAQVRKLLAHEFAHCFTLATKIVNHLDLGGELILTGDPRDESREAELLAEAPNWLGAADADLIRWDEPQFAAIDAEMVALADARQLPVSAPPPGTPMSRASLSRLVPAEWAARVRSLRHSV